MSIHFIAVRARAWARQIKKEAAKDAGYSTETVIVTALLVIMGIAVIGIIAAKVMGKAQGIDLGLG
ncbi:hypothetical protein ACFQVC_12945 [Streptomyces monticola]|uniref:Flp family type IVb pilin n=1 Tax=Streptomyces monticola TaxID=2666263 RepID=A0ABW2JGD6_9ACTN